MWTNYGRINWTKKVHWIGYSSHRNCLATHVMGENTYGKRRREKRCKQLLDELKEKKRYCNSLWKMLCNCRKTDYIMD
jgi:hypothetical protein